MNKATLFASIMLVTSPVLADDQRQYQHQHQYQPKAPTVDSASQRYIVMFEQSTRQKQQQSGKTSVFDQHGFSTAQANDLITAIGGQAIRALPSIAGMAVELSDQQLKQLQSNPQVALVEVDPLRAFQAEIKPYGIGLIQADLLSDASTGNIKICIADTGIALNHEDLPGSANITGEVSNTLTEPMDIGEWSQDTYGHGTHMAGTIAAVGGNNLGISGVNPGGNIKLHVVKIVDNPSWWPFRGSDVIAAVERCQIAGANIINMSIAGTNSSVAEQQALQVAYDAGILLVGASGNGGSSELRYPASYDSVISTAAVDAQETVWQFSHFNDQIELSAPGVNVKSLVTGNGYANLDGTSVAAAYISGAAGLVWSYHQQCNNAQIRNILAQTAKDLAGTGRDNNTGHGLIQVKAAVDLIDQRGCSGNGVLNNLPTITGTPSNSVNEGEFYLFTPTFADADAGDSLTLNIANKPSWASFNVNTGELSGTPADGDVGIYSDIAITVTDSKGASASTLLFAITVVNVDFPPLPTSYLQSLSLVGSDIVLTNPDGSVMSLLSVNDIIDVVSVDDADSDPENEIQTISQVGSTVTLSHQGGSFTAEKGDKGDQGSPGTAGANGVQGIQGIAGTSLWLDGSGVVSTTAQVTVSSTLAVAGHISSITPTANNHVVIKGYADEKSQHLQSQVDILLGRISQLEANYQALSEQVNPPPPPADSINISWQTLSYNERYKLTDPAGITWDKFGSSISISGRTLVIGADNKDDKGHVFVYYDSDNDGDFTDEVVQSLLPAEIGGGYSFGNHVANTDDTIVVGARMGNMRRGAIYIYHDSDHDGDYSEETPQKLIASDSAYGDSFGESVDISGHTIVVGASGTEVHGDRSGSIYIYTDSNKDHDFSDALEQKISPDNGGIVHYYGFNVAIEDNTIAVGAMGYNDNSGTVYVYHDANNDGVYTDEVVQQIVNNDHTDSAGFGIAVTLNDNILVIGAHRDNPSNGAYKGSAFVYKDSDLDGNYSEEIGDKFIAAEVTGSGNFGSAVAVSADTLIITAAGDTTATGTGSAYVYRDANNNGSFSDETPQRLETNAYGFAYEVAYQNNELFL
ncbi:MAG: serine protease, partial [Phenylobacterium sp.]